MNDRHKLNVAVYVIFRQEGKILFGRRANTGFMDGRLQLPSGHVEKNENLYNATAREALEEVGVEIKAEDLRLVFTAHRFEASGVHDYVDFYFEAANWNGELRNTEPEKCSELIWLDEEEVMDNQEIVEYVRLNFLDMKSHKVLKTAQRSDN